MRPVERARSAEVRSKISRIAYPPCMFVFGVLVTMIDSEAVELVGKGVRGGKRLAFSTASTPVRRRRIVHKSIASEFFGASARLSLGTPSPRESRSRCAESSLSTRTVAWALEPALTQGWYEREQSGGVCRDRCLQEHARCANRAARGSVSGGQ